MANEQIIVTSIVEDLIAWFKEDGIKHDDLGSFCEDNYSRSYNELKLSLKQTSVLIHLQELLYIDWNLKNQK
jgi:hypothetical protein